MTYLAICGLLIGIWIIGNLLQDDVDDDKCGYTSHDIGGW
jgi:hypothetical protein